MIYDETTLLRIGKRWQNTKRGYLLIDPLQAKHIPVSPTEARRMMTALGRKLAQANPADAVIGFAETATAVGAAVAAAQGEDCFYITTTREPLPESASVVSFLEEHSHAVDQQLDVSGFPFASARHIAVVDDEISTGKTILNMISGMKAENLLPTDTAVTAVSILNRLNEAQEQTFAQQNLNAVCLLHLPQSSYAEEMAKIAVTAAGEAPVPDTSEAVCLNTSVTLPNPRRGVRIGDYHRACTQLAAEIAEKLRPLGRRKALVLGTEECMYPAILAGEALENSLSWDVRCHATTRSPIGISREASYPIHSGSRIPSFHDPTRQTYIYNLASYDTALILTDAHNPNPAAVHALANLLTQNGVKEIFLITAGE